jgi:undecaprenyl-diphosphatase
VFWIPLYLFLIFLVAKKYGWKTLIVGLFIGFLFFVSDRTSVVFFKDVFERLRPCHNPEISALVHTLNGKCGGQFGFVSSHATNSFALAVFSGLLFKLEYKKLLPIMLFWAALVSYSRVYVGVHYPADILGGAILGSVIGLLVFYLMKFLNRKFNFNLNTK